VKSSGKKRSAKAKPVDQCARVRAICLALPEATERRRSHFTSAYERYEAKAFELLRAGARIGNADVCRALGQQSVWGLRYWRELGARHTDVLEGRRKVRLRQEE
jgi:hypothetical protein